MGPYSSVQNYWLLMDARRERVIAFDYITTFKTPVLKLIILCPCSCRGSRLNVVDRKATQNNMNMGKESEGRVGGN